MQQELEISKEEIFLDQDEKLTDALREIANQIAPEPKKDVRMKNVKNDIILKPVTKLTLEEAEWRWECKLKDEAIKLEGKLRERAFNYPNDPITAKVKEEIIWTIVNEEKQQETVSAILEKITDLINKGIMPEKEEIAQMIEESPNKKYLDIENILKQANFIKEAKKSIGTMHEETRKVLVKYIISNKNVSDLKEFFDKHTPQKQIDEIFKKEGNEVKSKNEIEKDTLMEIGELFLKTRRINPNEIKQIAEGLGLNVSDFITKVEMLKIKLSPTNIDPKNLERFVHSAIYTAEEDKRKVREIRKKYLEEIGHNYKEKTNSDLVQIANNNKIPLGVIKKEAEDLIRKINKREQQPSQKEIEEIIQEIVQ
jgi:hypothetical protein